MGPTGTICPRQSVCPPSSTMALMFQACFASPPRSGGRGGGGGEREPFRRPSVRYGTQVRDWQLPSEELRIGKACITMESAVPVPEPSTGHASTNGRSDADLCFWLGEFAGWARCGAGDGTEAGHLVPSGCQREGKIPSGRSADTAVLISVKDTLTPCSSLGRGRRAVSSRHPVRVSLALAPRKGHSRSRPVDPLRHGECVHETKGGGGITSPLAASAHVYSDPATAPTRVGTPHTGPLSRAPRFQPGFLAGGEGGGGEVYVRVLARAVR